MDFIHLATATSTRAMLRHLGAEPKGSADLVSTQSSVVPQAAGDVDINMDVVGSSPLLSQSAEDELYLLATNFLLYIAMIIIAVMIAKIYFPESLERGVAEDTPMPSVKSKSISYRVVGGPEINEETTGSDYSDGEGNDEVLGSDESDFESDDEDQNYAERSNVLEFEFQQENTNKLGVMKRLVFCCVMLNVTFVTWGILQERMLTRKYPRSTGENFTYSYALVFTNRLWTLLFSGLMLLYIKPRRSRTTIIYEYSFPSISNLLSSWCQYEALQYLSFPSATLFKSFKLAPVMLMGKILGNKTYPQYDYMVALMIGVGITMFMTSADDLTLGKNIRGQETHSLWTGLMLLFLYIFFDSFTSQWQSRMFQRHRDLSLIELMFATSACSTVLSMITLIHTQEVYPALSFIYSHPEIHWHFFMFSICSTIGQLFIYYTIKNFGAVVFTLIMTTRILLSIAVSCILYEHTVTGIGFLGIMLVVGAVLYRIKKKAEGQQLVKWAGIDDDKGHELMKEWHEHGDM